MGPAWRVLTGSASSYPQARAWHLLEGVENYSHTDTCAGGRGQARRPRSLETAETSPGRWTEHRTEVGLDKGTVVGAKWT